MSVSMIARESGAATNALQPNPEERKRHDNDVQDQPADSERH